MFKKSNKLNLLDDFDHLNLSTSKVVETLCSNSPIEKPKENESINDWLDELLN